MVKRSRLSRSAGMGSHAEHIAGGYFQKGCSQCAFFIEKYEKRRPWAGKTTTLRK
jgi:hypothetical protein